MLDEFRSTLITWDKATSRIYSPVTANASDENGRKLIVQIVNGGQVEDLTGATLHLYWITRDKAHDGLDVFDASDISKGEFELSYTTGMLSNQGVLNANLVLIDTVGRVVSERFKITVTEGIDNDAIQSENSFSSLTQALVDISNLEQNYAPRLNDLTAQLQHKAEIEYVDNKIGGIVSGSPKGTFNNLNDLQTSFPNGVEGVYVTTDTGKWYYWNDLTWAEGGIYQSTGVGKQSITPNKLYDYSLTVNNINTSDFEIGKIRYETGENQVANDAVRTADFIKVTPNTKYTIVSTRNEPNDAVYIYQYRSDKSMINYKGKVTGHIFTTDTDVEYLRFQTQTRGTNGYVLPDLENFDVVVTTDTISKYPTDYTLENLTLKEVSEARTDQTGEVHETLNSRLDKTENVLIETSIQGIVMTMGTILNTGLNQGVGAPYPNEYPDLNDRARTRDIIHVAKGSRVVLKDENYNYLIYFYENNDLKSFQSLTQHTNSYTFEEDSYIRIMIRHNQSNRFYIEDVKDILEFVFFVTGDKQYRETGMKITFIADDDTKEETFAGDSSFIQFPNGEVMGIDFNHASNYEKIRREYKSRGINRLDYIVVSHWHSDHVGTLRELIRSGTLIVDEKTKAFMPEPIVLTAGLVGADMVDAQTNVIDILNTKNVEIIYPSEFETHTIAGCDVVFWNTDHAKYYNTSTNYNDMSLCLTVSCGNYNAMFTGDIGRIAQDNMAGKLPKVNVYKAHHHGWDNGEDNLSPAYMNNISPDVVFSLDGKIHDEYIDTAGYPLQTWCERNNVSNYRTQINNTMDVIVNDKGYSVLTPVTKYIRNGKNWSFADNS